jgi:hypothetical protein
MKRTHILLLFAILTFYFSNAQVHVNGYFRKDGTYVQPHQRSSPDGLKSNNYSYQGNYNPNTGRITGGYGYVNQPSYNYNQKYFYYEVDYCSLVTDRSVKLVQINSWSQLQLLKINWYVIVDTSSSSVGYVNFKTSKRYIIYDKQGIYVRQNYNLNMGLLSVIPGIIIAIAFTFLIVS